MVIKRPEFFFLVFKSLSFFYRAAFKFFLFITGFQQFDYNVICYIKSLYIMFHHICKRAQAGFLTLVMLRLTSASLTVGQLQSSSYDHLSGITLPLQNSSFPINFHLFVWALGDNFYLNQLFCLGLQNDFLGLLILLRAFVGSLP